MTGKGHTMRKTLAALLVFGTTTVAGSAYSGATPVQTGCPSGYQYRLVSEWVAMGYAGLPPQLDATGNKDGYVCGLALPEGFTFGRFEKALGTVPQNEVLYLFSDNDSPAKR